MNFVSFDLAKKLKEKGFELKEPYAMYNELGDFHKLYTSTEERVPNRNYREYYDYCDFDDMDFVAPTISQVLNWLREEKGLFILIDCEAESTTWNVEVKNIHGYEAWDVGYYYNSYEDAALAGIEYTLDYVI